MTGYPAATRADHLSFCQIEKWSLVRRSTGKKVNHHITYRLPLPDGRILRTRISHPPGKQTYGPGLWRRILNDQLDVDEATFWACVHDKVVPTRGAPPPPTHSIPAELFQLLVGKAGLPETQVWAMTREEAIQAASDYWSRGRS